jgi:hypothetical protein
MCVCMYACMYLDKCTSILEHILYIYIFLQMEHADAMKLIVEVYNVCVCIYVHI